MKKYQYRFATQYESLEIDDELYDVLHELDRKQRNDDISFQKSIIHYDAFGFEPDFLGVEDDGFSNEDIDLESMFDGSPAYQYALKHLLQRHKIVLYRRAVQGETFAAIAKSFDTDASVIHSYYKRLCARFRKYYEEWVWLHSKDNIAPPGAGKVEIITKGLTPAQIMAIRAYRCQYRTLREISDLVGVSYGYVQECLHDNPILETPCPNCGAPVLQDTYSRMVVFCSMKCYFYWFRRHSQTESDEISTTRGKSYLTEPQKQMINFYRQLHINVYAIGKLLGVSRHHVEAFTYAFPLPYTLCEFCGAKIPPQKSGRLLKYCTPKCRERHDNKARTLRKRNHGTGRERIVPTAEQLELAIALRDEGFPYEQIQQLAVLTCRDIETLFRFYPTVVRECANCKKPFETKDIRQKYCSMKCKEKARYKRVKKQKKESQNVIL